MSTIGFDTASTITDAVLDKAVAKGVGYICLYTKWMSPGLVKRISGRGIKIVSVAESTASQALAGAAGGSEDAAKALQAVKVCGQLPGSAIYATVDFDATPAQETTVLEYLHAFHAALRAAGYRGGVYANGAVCQAALNAGIADYTWLAGGSGMRGTRDFAASGKATMSQDVGDKRGLNLGISIDSDMALAADYGGWMAGGAVVAPSSPQQGSEPTAPAQPDITTTIRTLQTQLAAIGLYKDAIDGIPGTHTLAAIVAWRAAQ